MARVQVIKQVEEGYGDEWVLLLQWCLYVYDDGNSERGYRFIWRRPDGRLQAARGQARIPSLKVAKALIDEAEKAGWGSFDADEETDKHHNKPLPKLNEEILERAERNLPRNWRD